MRGLHVRPADNAHDRRHSSKQPFARQLRLETLEERRLLAVAELVRDINVNTTWPGSDPSHLTNVDGELYFLAYDGSSRALWTSDGTDVGTVRVKEFMPQSYVNSFIEVNGALFFTVYDLVNNGRRELWTSDGTENGTIPVKTISQTDVVDAGSSLVNLDDKLYFFSQGGLWKSDGTTAGTVEVKRGFHDPSALRSALKRVNDSLFFIQGTINPGGGPGDYELWKSDGSETGTVPVKYIERRGAYPMLYSVDAEGTLFLPLNAWKMTVVATCGQAMALRPEQHLSGNSVQTSVTIFGQGW